MVVARTSFLLGKVTFRISLRTSEKKPFVRAGHAFSFPPRLCSSRVIATAFAIVKILLSLFPPATLPRRSQPASFQILTKSGRGGGIRTPKSGFGDRQFNR